MTPLRLWSNATDTEVRVKRGPGHWTICRTCHTKWRPVGKYVRRTAWGYGCPGCRLRRAGREEAK